VLCQEVVINLKRKMNLNWNRSLGILWLILAGFLITNLAFAAVSVSLPTVSATRGDTIEVAISASDLTGQNVFDFNGVVSFQENGVDFLGASASGCLTNQAGWGTPTVNTTEDGQAIFANFGSNTLSGTGDLIKLKFHLRGGFGDSTALTFTSFAFTRISNISPLLVNGKIKINLQPIRVVVTTNKGGQLQVIIDGQRQTVPFSTTWQPGAAHSISIDELQSGSEGSRYYFENWSDGGNRSHHVSPTTDVTYIANLRAEYYLKIQSDYGATQGTGWYPENAPVEIKVDSVYLFNSTKRAHFKTWVGSGAAGYSGNINPTTITLLGPTTQTAVWEIQYWLAVKTLPENLAVIPGSAWYHENQTATTGQATATISNRTFKGWRVDGTSVAGNPVSVLMNQAHEAIADYSFDITVTVTTSSGQGVVVVDGQTVNAPVQQIWSAGSAHTIGIPETQGEHNGIRFKFTTWSDGGNLSHSVAPQTNITYTAQLMNEYYFNVQTQPTSLGQLTGSGWYASNSLVSLGPAPETINNGTIYSFYSWVLNGIFNENTSFNIVMDQPKSATAIYYKNYYLAGQVKCGAVPVANLKVRLTGGKRDSVVTDESGNYVFQGVLPEKYSVAPVSNTFRFEPPAWNYSLLFSNKKLQNFTAIDIGAPTVKLLQPNGGERYTASTLDSIKWTVSDNVGIDSVKCYYSSNGGQTWNLLIEMGAQFTACPWFIPPKNGTSYRVKVVASDDAGNFGEDVSDNNFEVYGGVRVPDHSGCAPHEFSLNQNYPNPFNPVTVISYQLPKTLEVNLNIYNAAGQLIRNPVHEIQAPGVHRVPWNGQNEAGTLMPSGVYFYQLRAGDFSETRKMLFMR
jgi:hypothetical protein